MDTDDSEADGPYDVMPELQDYVEALWRGDAAAAEGSATRLRCLVSGAPDPAEAREAVELLGYLVSDRWATPPPDVQSVDGPAMSLSDAFASACELLRELGSPTGLALTLISWSDVAVDTGDTAVAIERLQNAKILLDDATDAEGQRVRTFAAAMLHRLRGELVEVETMFAEAARRSAELDLPIAEAACLADLAAIGRHRGDHGAAAEAFARAAALAAEDGLDVAVSWGVSGADARMAAGRAAVDQIRYRDAAQWFEGARSIYVAAGPDYVAPAASAAVHLGLVAYGKNERAIAEHWFRIAEGEYTTLGDTAGLGFVHFSRGNAALSRGDVQVAEPLLRQASQELLRSGHSEAAAGCLRLLGASTVHRGDQRTAQQLFVQSLEGFDDPDTRAVIRMFWALSPEATASPEDLATALAEIRSEFVERGELGKAVSAAAGELDQLLRLGRFDEARREVDTLASLAAEAMSDSRSGYVVPLLSYLPALLRAKVAMAETGHAMAWEPLRECHDAMMAAGAHLPAARTAIILAPIALESGRTREAANRAIPALLAMRAHHLALPDASERRIWSTAVGEAAHLSLVAADRLKDHGLVAELIETVRGHAMPEPVLASAAQSLQALLAVDGVGGDAGHPDALAPDRLGRLHGFGAALRRGRWPCRHRQVRRFALAGPPPRRAVRQ